MKLFALSFAIIGLFIFSFPGHASSAEQPYDICKNEGNCSAPQLEIAEKFKSCEGFNSSNFSDKVFSGTCYHNSRLYKNTDAHHVMSFFDWVGNDARFISNYSFYSKENPYLEISVEDVYQKYQSRLMKKNHTLNMSHPDFAHIKFDGTEPENVVEYWFKSCGNQVYIRGHWGYHHQFVCELNQN